MRLVHPQLANIRGKWPVASNSWQNECMKNSTQLFQKHAIPINQFLPSALGATQQKVIISEYQLHQDPHHYCPSLIARKA